MNRTKWIHVRVTEGEYASVCKLSSETTCQSISQYARKKLLDKPVTTYYRNQSVDLLREELILIRNSLAAIGNNYNQVVRKMHVLKDNEYVEAWLLLHEQSKVNVLTKIEETKARITNLNDQWSQLLKEAQILKVR